MAGRRKGPSKHRTVDTGLEEPWFKKQRERNRARDKAAKASRRTNRRNR